MDLTKLSNLVSVYFKLAMDFAGYGEVVDDDISPYNQESLSQLNSKYQSYMYSSDDDYKRLLGNEILFDIGNIYTKTYSAKARKFLEEMKAEVESDLRTLEPSLHDKMQEAYHRSRQYQLDLRRESDVGKGALHDQLVGLMEKRRGKGMVTEPPEDIDQKTKELINYLDNFPADEKRSAIAKLIKASKSRRSKSIPFDGWTPADLAWALLGAKVEGGLEIPMTTSLTKGKGVNYTPEEMAEMMAGR